MNSRVCGFCCKERGDLNQTNWSRHIQACKKYLNEADLTSSIEIDNPKNIKPEPEIQNPTDKYEHPKGSDHTCHVNLGSLQVNVAINELDRHILSTVTSSSHKTVGELELSCENSITGVCSENVYNVYISEGNYPQEHGHRFKTEYYYRILPSGERIKREWLTFNIRNNRMYCLYCMFFGKNKQNAWTIEGFHAWQRLYDIGTHEKTEAHINASIIIKMKTHCMPVLPQIYECKRLQIAENREIVNSLIEVTLFLGQHSLPFRGHREGWEEKNKGNFKDLTVLLSKFSPALAVYISKLQSKGKSEVNFLSWRRQNQIISSVAKCIKTSINSEIKTSKYFSVSIDTTFDYSRREQLAFIIRYVSFEGPSPVIKERLLSLKESPQAKGSQLFSLFQDICLENNLKWKTMLVGQSYDGANNMRGQYQGLQAFIKGINPAAIYTWCYAHRLNLIVVQVTSSSPDSVNLFGNLEELYNFISSSKKRVAYFENMQKERHPTVRVKRLKRVNTTRWMSYSMALQTVLSTFDVILDTLENIKITELSDFKVCSKANGLIDFLLTERFVVTAICYSKLFEILDPPTKMLQSSDIDLLGAANCIQVTLDKIKNMRSDNVFNKLYDDAVDFVNKSEFEFIPLSTKRCRRKKMMSDEINVDHLMPLLLQLKKDFIQQDKIY
ncbi:zinc finger MYM-type protein 1-like [Metopolophium dirhodum]|uniref:zinc finger MYM-type protein 1-like n=1 Tax=Metopolophium dirhodum TaxID=44670 RepID=UPI00299042F2|nr:zinc finger MYM-type protein 1-like [Metopolophium dirhodum]